MAKDGIEWVGSATETMFFPCGPVTMPEYSDWRCELVAGTTLSPLKGREPNWFHRKMQTLILGFRWYREDQ